LAPSLDSASLILIFIFIPLDIQITRRVPLLRPSLFILQLRFTLAI
jgi:hypothetical protein